MQWSLKVPVPNFLLQHSVCRSSAESWCLVFLQWFQWSHNWEEIFHFFVCSILLILSYFHPNVIIFAFEPQNSQIILWFAVSHRKCALHIFGDWPKTKLYPKKYPPSGGTVLNQIIFLSWSALPESSPKRWWFGNLPENHVGRQSCQ